MGQQDLAKAELARRTDLLPKEIKAWTDAARKNAKLVGIHGSQLSALALMMGVLTERHVEMLKQLPAAAPAAEFSQAYFGLVREIAGAQGLWHVFRATLALRTALGGALDAADLVAADCYNSCIDRVRRDWRLLDEQKLREPPLVMLEAGESPVAISRGGHAESVGLPLKMHRTQKLPIPVVILPFDHVGCVWLWCSIHHEVGHNLDQDLGLSKELAPLAERRLSAHSPSERVQLWTRWGEEVLADAVGVLLGGAGYGHFAAALFSLLAAMRPRLNREDVHPHEAVRLRLLAAMLKRMGDNACDAAAEAALATAPVAQPAAEMQWAEEWKADCNIVAEVYLDEPLPLLGNRGLRCLNPAQSDDSKLAERLALYLRKGFKEPDAGVAGVPFPWRLVPVAAQLALVEAQRTAEAPLDGVMKDVHDRSLRFLGRIPRPNWLAAEATRAATIREQAAAIHFGPPIA